MRKFAGNAIMRANVWAEGSRLGVSNHIGLGVSEGAYRHAGEGMHCMHAGQGGAGRGGVGWGGNGGVGGVGDDYAG